MKIEKPVAFNYVEAMKKIEQLEAENKRLKINLEIKSRIEQDKQDWIPCSERLPEKDGMYLITTKIGRVITAQYWTDYGKFAAAVAWQPLPEPFKGVEIEAVRKREENE